MPRARLTHPTKDPFDTSHLASGTRELAGPDSDEEVTELAGLLEMWSVR